MGIDHTDYTDHTDHTDHMDHLPEVRNIGHSLTGKRVLHSLRYRLQPTSQGEIAWKNSWTMLELFCSEATHA